MRFLLLMTLSLLACSNHRAPYEHSGFRVSCVAPDVEDDYSPGEPKFCGAALQRYFAANPNVRVNGINSAFDLTTALIVWTSNDEARPLARDLEVEEK